MEKQISSLRDMIKFRKEDNIIYMDKSCILSSHAKNKSCSDDSSQGLLGPLSKCQRFIIIHAGRENTFVLNTLLMWKSTQATGNYYQMNKISYEKEKLILSLPPNFVIVLDNFKVLRVHVVI
jgi:hypothetical protein